ncbi:MAG: helix-turn-helix transcriptional regulator [Pseudomonadota bacterium]
MELREWRKAKAISSAELAERCGVSEVSIFAYERGTRRPRPEIARRIEAATNGEVTAVELLGLSAQKRVQENPAPFTQAPAKLSEEARALGLNPEAIAEKRFKMP